MYAITGLGVISPLATTVAELWEAVREGGSAIAPLPDHLGEGVGACFSAPPASGFERRLLTGMDPVSVYAAMAAKQAYEQARLGSVDPCRVGTVVGVGVGGISTADEAYRRLYRDGRRVHALAVPRIMPSAAASNLSMALGIKGPTFVVSSACASSAHAVVEATHWLERGRARAMVAVGAEAPFAYGLMLGWRAMHILAPDTCRPFSIERKGMVIGEGAAALTLERLDDARARGVDVLGVLLGYGISADARHLVHPDQGSIVRAMRDALEGAGLGADQIDYINAHGTGTVANDATESAAIRELFADVRPPVSSTKGATGHLLGGAGAIEAVITLGALRGGWIPPTLNTIAPDPAVGLDICSGVARPAKLRCAMSNSLGFGGLNASLVLGHPSVAGA